MDAEGCSWTFDAQGRPLAGWSDGWFRRRGLSGKEVFVRWNKGRRELFSPDPITHELMRQRRRRALEAAAANGVAREIKQWIKKSLAYDAEADIRRFADVYGHVGILPPDQYDACVVQVTRGCAWNRCLFCHFYRSHPHEVRLPRVLSSHVDEVADLFGEGIGRCRSIFLGEANALGAPMETIAAGMRLMREKLVPRMPHFRGFYSFIEVSQSSCRTTEDFKRLAREGLRGVYYGLETADVALRDLLSKPGSLEEIAESIASAKLAGLSVSVILLVGPGGHLWADRHVRLSTEFIRQLPLGPKDLVYLSPLRGRATGGTQALSESELYEQLQRFRTELQPERRCAPYDIREFVY